MGADVEKGTEGSRKEVRDFTDVVGGSGRWQRRTLALFILMAMPCAWHNLSMSFLAPNVDYRCATSPEKNTSDLGDSGVGVAQKEDDQCYVYTYLNSSHTDPVNASQDARDTNELGGVLEPCRKWTYNDSLHGDTVVSQWDLVCDKAWMVSMTNSVLMCGFLTSVLVLGQAADKIGRRPVIVGSSVILLVSGLVCAFSMSFMMFTISRFFIAFGAAGIFNTGFTLLMEVVSAESRSIYGIVCEFGWSAGYVMLPGIAWFVRDWFWLQLALTLPCIGLLASWWLIPESPRWLITQGKMEKAEKVLTEIAETNRKNVQDISCSLKKIWPKNEQATSKQKASIFDLFRRGLWHKTLNLYFCWFVNSFIYYGLSFNTNDLSGNAFLNFAIAGAVEFPAYAVTMFVIKSLGRRIPLMGTMVAGGLACLLTVPLTGDLSWVRVPLSMFGKFCITASFGIVYVFSAEIFPTVVRNTGVGSSSMCARIGSILAPFVKELGHATHPAVPLACYGILSIISGVLIMLLPETNRCKVPDTFEEAAACGRKKPKPFINDEIQEEKEQQNPCIVHDGTTEKLKPAPVEIKPPAPPVVTKSMSDGKKLPDLLEEPSVVDEAAEENNRDRNEDQEQKDDEQQQMQPQPIQDPEPAAAVTAPVPDEPAQQVESLELKEAAPLDSSHQQHDATEMNPSPSQDVTEAPQQTPL